MTNARFVPDVSDKGPSGHYRYPRGQMFGREAEFTRAVKALDALADGHAASFVVEGEAGIGKSTLLAAAAEEAARRGHSVFAGRVDEIGSGRPFGALVDALRCSRQSDHPLRREIGQIVRSERDEVAAAGGRTIVIEHLVELIEEEALREPTVLVIDDLHWADASTIAAIGEITSRLTYLPVAVLTGFRPFPESNELSRLVGAMEKRGADRVVLGPLGAAAVAELVAAIRGEQPDGSLGALIDRAAGNPLFISELARATPETDSHSDHTSVPNDVLETVRRRVKELPPPVVEALELAAVLGSVFEVGDLAMVMRLPTIDVTSRVSDAVTAGILGQATEDHRVQFRHDLIRDAVYSGIPTAVRMTLHREAATALADGNANPLTVAQQYSIVAQPGDQEAAEWLVRAARTSASSSPEIAIKFLEQVRELTDPGGSLHTEASVELAGILASSGHVVDGESVARATIDTPHDTAFDARLWDTIVTSLFLQGRQVEILTLTEPVIAGQDMSMGERARLKARRVFVSHYAKGPDAAMQEFEEATAFARQANEPFAEARALMEAAPIATGLGYLREGVAQAKRAAAILDGFPRDVEARLFARGVKFFDVLACHDFEEAEAIGTAGRELAERTGQASFVGLFDAAQGERLLRMGRLDDAEAQSEAGMQNLGAASGVFRLIALAVLGRVALFRGDLAQASEYRKEARETLHEQGPRWGLDRVHWLDVLLTEATDTGAAAVLADELIASGQINGWYASRMGPDFIRLLLASGNRNRAEEIASVATVISERAGTAHAHGIDELCRGLIESDLSLLDTAAETFHAVGTPREQALAREAAGLLLADRGTRTPARKALKEAVELYRGMGAHGEENRVRAKMRELGFQIATSGRSQRPTFGWDSLTPSELDVVRLAARGLTNVQIGDELFVSRHTVHSHLKHIFGKLGINSRVDLAVQANERDLVPA